MERTGRYTLLVHLSDNKSAAAFTADVVKTLRRLPEHMRISLTSDRGMEMADHTGISSALRMPVFFCDPASPHQSRTNENTNSLLEWPQKVGLGNGTLRDGGCSCAVFVQAEVSEVLLDEGGVPPF